MHAVAVKFFDFVQPFRPFRGLLHELGQLRPIKRPRSAALPIGPYGTIEPVRPPGSRREAGEAARIRTGEIEPSKPIRMIQDDHLSIVYRRPVGTRFGRQECERFPGSVGHWATQLGEAEPVLGGLGEFPLRFRWFRTRELEEVR
jgi:hypothetical protein